MTTTLTITRLAREAGVKTSTVRFYERRGLVRPKRQANGYRSFSTDDVRRLQFIRRAAGLGFTLAEIQLALRASDRGGFDDAGLRALAAGKVRELEQQLADLERVRAGLQQLLRRRRTRPGTPCPLLEALAPCS